MDKQALDHSDLNTSSARLTRDGSAVRWSQPLALALLGEQSFRKVDSLFELAHSLFQLIEFAKADLNIFQRLSALGRIRYTGLEIAPRALWEDQPDQDLGGSYEQDDHPDPD